MPSGGDRGPKPVQRGWIDTFQPRRPGHTAKLGIVKLSLARVFFTQLIMPGLVHFCVPGGGEPVARDAGAAHPRPPGVTTAYKKAPGLTPGLGAERIYGLSGPKE